MPSRQPQGAVERQQRLRHRRADEHRHGRRGHEERPRLRALRRRYPVGQVQHHPGEEPGLGDAEQDAHGVEAPLPDHEHHRHRHEAPPDHDPRDPDPRSHPVQDQVARDLEQAVAEEEQPAAEAVGRVAQVQVALQLGRRESDVHAVDVGDDVADEDEGDEATDNARNRRAALLGIEVGHLCGIQRARHRNIGAWRCHQMNCGRSCTASSGSL